MTSTRSLVALATTLVFAVLATPALAHPGQHGTTDGHLVGTGEWGKIDYLSDLRVHDAEEGLIADVAVDPDGDYAYLARWGGSDCAAPETGGQTSPDGGVYVVDISDLENPVEVGFIPTQQDTLVGEGMQVVHVETAQFTGDVLLMNHEQCGKNGKAGISLWDVTNPLKPRKLSEHFGDFTTDGVQNTPHDANQTHSAFIWQDDGRAYLVATDDDEASDVDIFDITNPKKPVLVGEFDLNDYGVSQPELGLTDSFLHDMVVKEIDGRQIMLLSYWDGGYVLLDVGDPANPVFLGDSDYATADPEVLAAFGISLVPEGNGHQAEFTSDNRFVIATDEDFDPYRLTVATDDGGLYNAKAATQTTIEEAMEIQGTTIFVGQACPGGDAVPSAPATGGPYIAVVERGNCFFEEKVQAILAAGGYDAVIIMNREGPDACNATTTPSVTTDGIPVVFVSREAGFELFDDTSFDIDECLAGSEATTEAPMAIGTVGDVVTDVGAVFDGWGYVHLFGVDIEDAAASLTELDTFVIPEAMDPDFAEGFGDLSVHEVATDPQDPGARTCRTTQAGYGHCRSSARTRRTTPPASWSRSAAISTRRATTSGAWRRSSATARRSSWRATATRGSGSSKTRDRREPLIGRREGPAERRPLVVSPCSGGDGRLVGDLSRLGGCLGSPQQRTGGQRSGRRDARGAEERRGVPVRQGGEIADLVGAVRRGEGGHRRQAERGADLVAGVDDAGGEATLLGLGRLDRRAQRRDERERHPGRSDQRSRQHVHEERAVGPDEREDRHASGEQQQADDRRHLDAEPRDHPGRDDDHAQHDRAGHRQQRRAALERPVPEHLLQVEVQEKPHRDPGPTEQDLGQVGRREIRRAQDAEPHQRLAARGLERDERGEQCHTAGDRAQSAG